MKKAFILECFYKIINPIKNHVQSGEEFFSKISVYNEIFKEKIKNEERLKKNLVK